MKKSILIFSLCILSAPIFAQKPDTTVQVTMTLDQFKAFLTAIDQNIDSKKVTNEMIGFLQKQAKIVQPAKEPEKAPEVKKK